MADPTVVDGVVGLFENQRDSGGGPITTEVTTNPKVTESDPERVLIEDCVLLEPSFTEAVGVWYEARLRSDGENWKVESLLVRSASGCVSASMADEAIAGYEGYYRAEAEFWDPPDPDHPLLEDVVTDPQLTFLAGLLESHRARGVALRGSPTLHPEVIEVRGPRELVLSSCNEPAIDFGLYELATGMRLPDEPEVREGQRDLQSAVMVLHAGKWKVSDLQGQVDFKCEFAPTERGLPEV